MAPPDLGRAPLDQDQPVRSDLLYIDRISRDARDRRRDLSRDPADAFLSAHLHGCRCAIGRGRWSVLALRRSGLDPDLYLCVFDLRGGDAHAKFVGARPMQWLKVESGNFDSGPAQGRAIGRFRILPGVPAANGAGKNKTEANDYSDGD